MWYLLPQNLKSLINDLRRVYILQRDRLKDLLSLTL